MCMMSAVFDQWRPAFPPVQQPIYPWNPAPQVPNPPKQYTTDDLRKLVEAFQKALDAAKAYDDITGQPDCEDPDKAKLLARITQLEQRLALLEAAA
jgi:hypothetical protein